MNKIYRSVCLALAVSVGAILGMASAVFAPAILYVAHGCEALACGVAKLKRELACKFSEASQTGFGASAGLRSESNGYRQSHAPHDMKGCAPALG